MTGKHIDIVTGKHIDIVTGKHIDDRGAVEKNSTSTEIGLEGRSCGKPRSEEVNVVKLNAELGFDAEYTNC